ncbi:VanZ family protein [Paenisporosarcina indica]|uniref:VanZ family protein n=1 Tax=Paenisporosarcina indica TaxID=650093 RepID=UPI00094FFB0D|nr:VanZ family protein [Paenisporosarcina indica]
MKKYILLILILLALFYSSGQTYEEQSLIPDLKRYLPNEPLKGILSTLQVPYWGTTVSIEERGYHAFVEFLIRKGAHVFIFGALAAAIYYAIRKFFLAFAVTVIFAIIDEYHQSLTGGRTPTIHDVLLDSFGAALVLLVIFLIKKYRSKRKKST